MAHRLRTIALASDGQLEKGCIAPKIGVDGCRNFHQISFFFIISATDMLESHSRAPKTRILA